MNSNPSYYMIGAAWLLLHVFPAQAQPPADVAPSGTGAGPAEARPAPSPSVPPPADLALRMKALIERLEKRTGRPRPPGVLLSFSRLKRGEWPPLEVEEIRIGPKEASFLLKGDPDPHVAGDAVQGVRVVSVTPEMVLLELGGERKVLRPPQKFPVLSVRAIKQVENVWVVFFGDEPRAYYAGDTYKGVQILGITPRQVSLRSGTQERTLGPDSSSLPFPAITFAGSLRMPEGLVVFVAGEKDGRRVGDRVRGARITAISETEVTLEFQGQTRRIPVR